ncbi:DUF6404 family protein [Kribbella sp. NPDC051770]|uniref:DUF6404 family protein n=1 Tax=Kribbella sp. NPDC051770 TaxID=3155413 RepID=UPI00341D497D
MRTSLRDAPAWQVAIVSGILFGVLFGLGLRILGRETWTAALVAAAFTGPAFGSCMAAIHRRERRLFKEADFTNLTKEQLRAAQKAAWRGPVPSDPMIRTAATQLARVQLLRVGSRWLQVMAALLLVVDLLSTVLSIIDGDSWRQTLGSACGAVLFGSFLVYPRTLRRRISVLSAG